MQTMNTMLQALMECLVWVLAVAIAAPFLLVVASPFYFGL